MNGFRRVLSTWDATMVVVGGIIGSGIFINPYLVARGLDSPAQVLAAWALGGGLDIKLSKHVSFRPIGLDWFKTKLDGIRTLQSHSQDNLRYTAGVNFTFGAQ
jgi:hypothetical protein